MIKLKSLIEESNLIPRRSVNDRLRNYSISIHKYLQNYVKNESKGDLDFSNLPFDVAFPDDIITIDGTLNLRNSKVSKLPKNLKYVLGDLNLRGSDVSEIPDSLIGIIGNLWMEDNAKINSLKNLKMARGIYLNGDKVLKNLPNDLHLAFLDISESNIRELPSGLNVRDLNIENTHITRLPDDLIIRGSVYASDSQLSYINRDISCYNLEIHDTPFLYNTFFKNAQGISPANIREKLKEYFPNVKYVRGYMRKGISKS